MGQTSLSSYLEMHRPEIDLESRPIVHPSMTKLVFTVAGFALAAAPSLAEQPARCETAILYSYLRSGSHLGSDSGLTSGARGEGSFHSYRWGSTVFLNRRFGLGGDLVTFNGVGDELLFGPEIGLLDKDRVDVRLHPRVGSVSRLVRDPTTESTRDEWNFASTIGFSVNVYLGKGFAWRVLHPEIVWWRRGENHAEFRVSTGVVLRFGRTY
jgi:hypothetical protein